MLLSSSLGMPAAAIFRYYSEMFSASGMLSLTREKQNLESRSSFLAICGIACLSTLVAIAVSAKFFLPSYISLAYAICVFLVVQNFTKTNNKIIF
mmetsp:Transcript_13928/g.28146  ORF Transcript_13928/g.28146 Transcript_13928/m.28146 type:complete len:95 (+) Transcript_13928:77-361(+)